MHTPEIVAPETLGSLRMPLARESSPVDMWSSGALLYTLLCGAPPFGYVEMDGVDVLFARVSTAYHDQCLSAAWVGVSEDAKELVNGLLHRDPLKRPTAAEVLQHPWVAAALAQGDHANPLDRARVALKHHNERRRRPAKGAPVPRRVRTRAMELLAAPLAPSVSRVTFEGMAG